MTQISITGSVYNKLFNFFTKDLDLSKDGLLIQTDSPYMDWVIYKVFRSGLDKNIEVFHLNKNEDSFRKVQTSLFDDIESEEVNIVFSESVYKSEAEAGIVVLSRKFSKGVNYIKIDEIIRILSDIYKTVFEDKNLWDGIIKSQPRDVVFGKLIYEIDSIYQMERKVNLEILDKYGFNNISDKILFETQNIFKNKNQSISFWNKIRSKYSKTFPMITGYLKNTGEKITFSGESLENSPLKGMHPFAKDQLDKIKKSEDWYRKGLQNYGEVLSNDRKLKRVSLSEEDLLRRLFLFS